MKYEQLDFPFECHTQQCSCHSHNGFLTRAGYRALDLAAQTSYLDRSVSVSGSRRDETTMIFDEGVIDEQHRRFLDPVGGF